jgi:hypothetical protein
MDSTDSKMFEPVDIRAIPDDQLDDILGGSGHGHVPQSKMR